jgi:hypothetical protein
MAAMTLAEGKAARRADHEAAPLRSPRGVDPHERDLRLLHWFAPHVRRELEHLALQIDELAAGGDREIADVLMVALSSILYKVSRRASDTDPRRVERRVGRGAAARLFRERLDLLVTGLRELAAAADAPPGWVRCGDARQLEAAGIRAGEVTAIVSSPPYAGTYDYSEQHQLRLDFLGIEGERFVGEELGSRRQFSGDGEQRRRARRRWVRALAACVAEMERVLRPGGCAALMIGDSVAGDRAMWADETLAAALEKNAEREGGSAMETVAWAWQQRPKYGALEREVFAERPKRECLFLVRKAG